MKRRCIVNPTSDQKSVKASTDTRFNKAAAKRLLTSLKEVYNQLEAMGYDTYKAVDGENMQDDIDIYVRQIDILLREE